VRFAPPVQRCTALTIRRRRRRRCRHLIAPKILFIFVKIDVIFVICFVLLAVDDSFTPGRRCNTMMNKNRVT